MVTVMAIVDEAGRILAAQFGAQPAEGDNETPLSQLLPAPGQRMVQMDVPDEIEQLPGPELSRFFAHVEVTWAATIDVPRVEIVRRSHEHSD
jgi:hypothetical protein